MGPITFRTPIDAYKSARSAWEADVKRAGTPPHEAMREAGDRSVFAPNKRAGIPEVLTGEEELPMVGVLDDDGYVFAVVDNARGQEPCVEAFLPARPGDVAEAY